MGPNFRSKSGTLNALKAECAAACDADVRCEKASMYYAGTGTCYLHDSNCGDYENNRHGSYHTYFKPVAATPAPVAGACSGSGTIMPGGDCSPWNGSGAKCCTDGGVACVYVNGSEYKCLPCDDDDMHTVGFGDADGHCSQNPQCEYDVGTSKCKDKNAASKKMVCKGHDVSQDARCSVHKTQGPCEAEGVSPFSDGNCDWEEEAGAGDVGGDAGATPAPVAAGATPAPVAADCKGIQNLSRGVYIRVQKAKLEQKIKLVDENADPICECHDVCEQKGADAFMYFTKGRKKTTAMCKCYMDIEAASKSGKLRMQFGKRAKGKNAGWITDAAKNLMGSMDIAKETKKRRRRRRRRN